MPFGQRYCQRRTPCARAENGDFHGGEGLTSPQPCMRQLPQTSVILTYPLWPSRCLTFSQPEAAGSATSSKTFLSAVKTTGLASCAAAWIFALATVTITLCLAASILDWTQDKLPAASRTLLQSP